MLLLTPSTTSQGAKSAGVTSAFDAMQVLGRLADHKGNFRFQNSVVTVDFAGNHSAEGYNLRSLGVTCNFRGKAFTTFKFSALQIDEILADPQRRDYLLAGIFLLDDERSQRAVPALAAALQGYEAKSAQWAFARRPVHEDGPAQERRRGWSTTVQEGGYFANFADWVDGTAVTYQTFSQTTVNGVEAPPLTMRIEALVSTDGSVRGATAIALSGKSPLFGDGRFRVLREDGSPPFTLEELRELGSELVIAVDAEGIPAVVRELARRRNVARVGADLACSLVSDGASAFDSGGIAVALDPGIESESLPLQPGEFQLRSSSSPLPGIRIELGFVSKEMADDVVAIRIHRSAEASKQVYELRFGSVGENGEAWARFDAFMRAVPGIASTRGTVLGAGLAALGPQRLVSSQTDVENDRLVGGALQVPTVAFGPLRARLSAAEPREIGHAVKLFVRGENLFFVRRFDAEGSHALEFRIDATGGGSVQYYAPSGSVSEYNIPGVPALKPWLDAQALALEQLCRTFGDESAPLDQFWAAFAPVAGVRDGAVQPRSVESSATWSQYLSELNS